MASGIRFYPGDRGRLEFRNVLVLEVVHFASQLNTQVFGRLRRLLRAISRHSILPHAWPRRPPELLADLGVDDVLNADRGDPLAGAERLLLHCGEELFCNLLCGRVQRHWERLA
jgi:hypothetical protein